MIVTCRTSSGDALRLEAVPGGSLMSLLRQHQTGVEAICGGAMSCGTCHVYVDEAWWDRLPPADDAEEGLLQCLDARREMSRLSCQIRLAPELDGLELVVADNS